MRSRARPDRCTEAGSRGDPREKDGQHSQHGPDPWGVREERGRNPEGEISKRVRCRRRKKDGLDGPRSERKHACYRDGQGPVALKLGPARSEPSGCSAYIPMSPSSALET